MGWKCVDWIRLTEDGKKDGFECFGWWRRVGSLEERLESVEV